MRVGDKVKIIDEDGHSFKIGEVGIIKSIHSNGYQFVVKINKTTQWVSDYQIELISETNSYYSFFRFLHPNMEENTCEELFNKIIKDYESSDRVE